MSFTLASRHTNEDLLRWGGAKAASLSRLTQEGLPVPDWFCVSFEALRVFLRENHLQEDLFIKPNDLGRTARDVEQLFTSKRLPQLIEEEIGGQLIRLQLMNQFVVVRSSEMEDVKDFSAPEPYTTFLFLKGIDQVSEAIKRCWASAYSEKALADRLARGHALRNIRLGIVVQKMVNAECSGIALTRNPRRPRDRKSIEIQSIWGPSEGSEFDAKNVDKFTVDRETNDIRHNIGEKLTVLRLSAQGYPVKSELPQEMQVEASVTRSQVLEVTKLAKKVEEKFGAPQKIQWAFSENKIYCFQTRPIPSLPPDIFYQHDVRGKEAIVWDRESLATGGDVMRPLYFSLIRQAARERQRKWSSWSGLPTNGEWVGLIRGRVYCNVVRWYESLAAFPNPALKSRVTDKYSELKKQLPSEIVPQIADLKPAGSLGFWDRVNLWLLRRKASAHAQSFEQELNSILSSLKTVGTSLEAKAKAFRAIENVLIANATGLALRDFGQDLLAAGPLNGLKDFKASDGTVARAWQAVDQIFCSMGAPLVDLGVLSQADDVTFLTADEIVAYVEGTAVSTDLKSVVLSRRHEYLSYERNAPPPNRLITEGAAALWFEYPHVLAESAVVLKDENVLPPKAVAPPAPAPTPSPKPGSGGGNGGGGSGSRRPQSPRHDRGPRDDRRRSAPRDRGERNERSDRDRDRGPRNERDRGDRGGNRDRDRGGRDRDRGGRDRERNNDGGGERKTRSHSSREVTPPR